MPASACCTFSLWCVARACVWRAQLKEQPSDVDRVVLLQIIAKCSTNAVFKLTWCVRARVHRTEAPKCGLVCWGAWGAWAVHAPSAR
jgi:hypothetical protein